MSKTKLGIVLRIAAAILVPLIAVTCEAQPGSCEQYVQAYSDASAIILNEMVDESNFVPVADGTKWSSKSLAQSNTRYIRFRFDQIHAPPGLDFSVSIVNDLNGFVVATLPGKAFAASDTFTTDLLPPGTLHVELFSHVQPAGLSFRLERALWQARSSTAAVHSPILLFKPVKMLPAGHPALGIIEAVGLVHIGPTETTCTGILVSDNTVATNYHCLQFSLSFLGSDTNRPSCADIMVEFDYLARDQRGTTASCTAVKPSDKADVALLTVNPQTIRTRAGLNRLPIQQRPIGLGIPQKAALLQHPLGLPLSIVEGCDIEGIEGVDLLHSCTSTNGSSGSALVDEQMRWVGLHYKGAYPDNWTFEQANNDFLDNGPSFNRAKTSDTVLRLVAQ